MEILYGLPFGEFDVVTVLSELRLLLPLLFWFVASRMFHTPYIKHDFLYSFMLVTHRSAILFLEYFFQLSFFYHVYLIC